MKYGNICSEALQEDHLGFYPELLRKADFKWATNRFLKSNSTNNNDLRCEMARLENKM